MSWNVYLALILFFDYTKSTHDMLRHLSAFPDDLVDKLYEAYKTAIANISVEEDMDEDCTEESRALGLC